MNMIQVYHAHDAVKCPLVSAIIDLLDCRQSPVMHKDFLLPLPVMLLTLPVCYTGDRLVQCRKCKVWILRQSTPYIMEAVATLRRLRDGLVKAEGAIIAPLVDDSVVLDHMQR